MNSEPKKPSQEAIDILTISVLFTPAQVHELGGLIGDISSTSMKTCLAGRVKVEDDETHHQNKPIDSILDSILSKASMSRYGLVPNLFLHVGLRNRDVCYVLLKERLSPV